MGTQFLIALSLLLAGCSQKPVTVVDNSAKFYGPDATYDAGVEQPRYSDAQRAMQPEEIAEKYHSKVHVYGVGAPVKEVAVNDMAAVPVAQPAPVALAPVPLAAQTQAYVPAAPSAASPTLEPIPALSAPDSATASTGLDWPIRGQVISGFGPRADGRVNDGINIAAAEGSPVLSSEQGEVMYTGNELQGYGNLIIISHPGGWMTAYAHLAEMRVKHGEKVNKGQPIGTVGRSGQVSEPQLHFSMRQGKQAVDPMTMLPRSVAGISQ